MHHRSTFDIAMIQAFLPSRGNGGVGHLADQLANHLLLRGHRVTMFSLDPAPAGSGYTVVNPPRAYRLTRGRVGLTYGFAVWVARQNLSGFDIVHAMGDSHFLRSSPPVVRTFCGSALAEARHARRARTAVMYASLYPLEVVAALRARRTVTISEDTARYFPAHHQTIPPGVDLEVFRPGWVKADHPVLLAVGHRLYDRKRLGLLAEVFCATIRPALPDAELWMVCDETIDLPGIRCFRSLATERLAELYGVAWVFCLPSAYEGFGRPYVEALASGTPVVATPNPGAREILADGRYGDICTPSELGPTIVRLLRDAERRRRLARIGTERAREYGLERVALDYEEVYRSALTTVLRPAS